MGDPKRQRRLWYAAGAAAVIVFVAFGATSFRDSMTPYVSIEEARASGSRVQVAGELVTGSSRIDRTTDKLTFRVIDDGGSEMVVVYGGIKPGNFEEADKIVVVGSYRDGVFNAEDMLVKCPSKYAGPENA